MRHGIIVVPVLADSSLHRSLHSVASNVASIWAAILLFWFCFLPFSYRAIGCKRQEHQLRSGCFAIFLIISYYIGLRLVCQVISPLCAASFLLSSSEKIIKSQSSGIARLEERGRRERFYSRHVQEIFPIFTAPRQVLRSMKSVFQ